MAATTQSTCIRPFHMLQKTYDYVITISAYISVNIKKQRSNNFYNFLKKIRKKNDNNFLFF